MFLPTFLTVSPLPLHYGNWSVNKSLPLNPQVVGEPITSLKPYRFNWISIDIVLKIHFHPISHRKPEKSPSINKEHIENVYKNAIQIAHLRTKVKQDVKHGLIYTSLLYFRLVAIGKVGIKLNLYIQIRKQSVIDGPCWLLCLYAGI